MLGGSRDRPSALHSYEQVLSARLLPRSATSGCRRCRGGCVQELVDELVRQGCAPSTVRNTILPLRAIYRRAVQRGELAHNPTLALALPAVRARRERVACPAEADALVATLPAAERALSATALYAGPRRGELQALRWQNIDLERGLIRVEHSWDRCAGLTEPKAGPACRRVPIPAALPASRSRTGCVAARRFGLCISGRRREPPVRLRLGDHKGKADLAGCRAGANWVARMPPQLRRLRDRRRHQPKGAQQLHGPQLDHRHARPRWAPLQATKRKPPHCSTATCTSPNRSAPAPRGRGYRSAASRRCRGIRAASRRSSASVRSRAARASYRGRLL